MPTRKCGILLTYANSCPSPSGSASGHFPYQNFDLFLIVTEIYALMTKINGLHEMNGNMVK